MNYSLKNHKISIQSKLILIMAIVSTISLLLAASMFTLYQLREYRVSMLENLTSAARITAENAQAAVWFQNQADADNILKEFTSDPRILTAAIYAKDKTLFSAYDLTNDDLSVLFEFPDKDMFYLFEPSLLHLVQPIKLQGNNTVVGYVYLKATLKSIHNQFKQNVLVTAFIVIAVLFVTIFIASKLQKIISGPILRLSNATKAIKDKKDYSIRVGNDQHIEIQHLCDGFNSMLEEIQKRDDHLQNLALYDELTGIPNRTLFINHFDKAIAHSKRTDTQLAICFLDIDNFKPINDHFGHKVGDQLLIEVAKRIINSIREQDTISRQGGDEFAILLGDINSLQQCKQTIERIYTSIAKPYLIGNDVHRITISSGITLYPDDDGDIDTLIRHADQAMYNAKLAGKHCFHIFNPTLDKKIIQKHHQLSEIENALLSKQLTLFYQPKVNMITGKIFGAEALLRWIHPDKGLIPPLEFLPAIEGSELESQLGNWVIEQALQQIEQWKLLNINLEVSVNVSSRHLQTDSFVSQLDKVLTKYPAIDPSLLQLEILESSALGDVRTVSEIINSCQALGVRIALDDFGTGYSSLTHLRRLPVDVIKIDQSFVRDILDDPSDYAIVHGVIGLADSFNRSVIAEGVETTEHGLVLLISNCIAAQGYGIAKPMPVNEFNQWYANYTPNQDWLACGKEKRTIKQSKIILFKLFIDQWVSRVIQTANDGSSIGPVMDYNNHAIHWMKRETQEQIFEPKWLQDLKTLHEQAMVIANDLLHKYQMDDVDIAIQNVDFLHSTVDKISKLLQQGE